MNSDPVLRVFHSMLKEGKIGFYCHNCKNAKFDALKVYQNKCWEKKDTTKFKFISNFCDRWFLT